MGDLLSKFLPRLWSNWISAVGTVLTTASAITMALQLVADAGSGRNPYASAILLLVMPAFFIAGLVLIPIGLWFARRARKGQPQRAGEPATSGLFTYERTRNRLPGIASMWICASLMGSGWQNGIIDAVFLTAMTPAMMAVSKMGPFAVRCPVRPSRTAYQHGSCCQW